MVAAGHDTNHDLTAVIPGSQEAAIIDEELTLLAKVQKQLAEDSLTRFPQAEYDSELISLRDQIAEAHIEDLAPLIAEMYRMQALGQANGKGQTLPVDMKCPYFGHLKLKDGGKVRDVLIGNRGFVKPGAQPIVDWRNAPVSRIYYCYDEGDDYDDNFGGRPVSGTVEARRTVGIVNGELRRITWSGGSVARRSNGQWVSIPLDQRPVLQGGAGVAMRPPPAGEAPAKFNPGKLGVVGDEALREDKHLKEITALIDPKQFELITHPESGIVILQGGAGSGKTTVALHRAAYLHFTNPSTFSPKKMVVVVKSEPLTEYISRVLPSLDVSGTMVVTLADWMQRTRKKVLPEIKRKYANDAPAAVSRLKKHPAMLRMFELAVERDARSILDEMLERAGDDRAKPALERKWTSFARLALLPRIREMQKWLDGAQASGAGVDAKMKSAIGGVLRRARSAHDDLLGAWADVMTDEQLLRGAFESYGKSPPTKEEMAELIRWVGLQAEDEPEVEDEEDREPAPERAEIEADIGVSVSTDDDSGEDVTDHRIGVDGRALDEDSPAGKLDEHDDALLLQLVRLKYGGLPVAGSQRTVNYEHIVVDEAQDLSPTDIAVLRGALTKRESMTLAGDTAQKLIFDNGFDDWQSMLRDVGIEGVKIDQLEISYRSTRQIVDFSRAVLGPLADPVEPVVPRTGAPVEQFLFGSTGEAIAFIGESLRSLVVREKKANVAVVARFSAQADIYYAGLKKAEVPALRRIYGKEFSFSPGIDVVDVAQIKGLEYDYVVLVEVNANTYGDAKEARHLLHIGATRAVHQLWVTSVAEPSPLLPPSMF